MDNQNAEPSSSTSKPSNVSEIPLVDNYKFLYGRVDEEVEESLGLVDAVPEKERETTTLSYGKIISNEESATAESQNPTVELSDGTFDLSIYSVSLEMQSPV